MIIDTVNQGNNLAREYTIAIDDDIFIFPIEVDPFLFPIHSDCNVCVNLNDTPLEIDGVMIYSQLQQSQTSDRLAVLSVINKEAG